MKQTEWKCVFIPCGFVVVLLISGVSSYPENTQTFDFIIVGGGTAGCVLASRLSENPNLSVLVIEAGGVPPEFLNVPGFAKTNELNPEFTFQYESVPQLHAYANNSRVRVSRGRVLGGSSQIHYMVFHRGSPYDFNNWANITGDPSWTYSSMLKYFKRSETYLGEHPDRRQHGFKGPIPVSYQEYAPGVDEWLNAGRELGYAVSDPNGPQRIGFSRTEFSRKFGRRVSAFGGYLKPVLGRSNLHILTNSYAKQLLFEGNTAVGVRYSTQSGGVNLVLATREVIVSSGTYDSATLLLRSGIGPRGDLRKLGIRVIKDLPVGRNLQEHPVLPLHIILNNRSLALNPATDFNRRTYQEFLENGRGPYTSVAGYGPQAFFVSSVAKSNGESYWPDIQVSVTSVTTRQPSYRNFSIAPHETSIDVRIYIGREKSRGTVTLDPNDIEGKPLIDFKYLDDERDEQVLLDAIDETLNVFENTRVYQSLGARFPDNPVPQCDFLKFRSKEYWKCFITYTLIGGDHPAGTCAIGSVVDTNFKVIGMRGLRVVDASVMPVITNSNLHAAIYGIAEKASDVILRDYADKI